MEQNVATHSPPLTEDHLVELRRRLVRSAHLFERPDDYVAGVEDTLTWVKLLLDREGRLDLELPPYPERARNML
ncbi:MAG: hypothetical protein ACRDUY_16395 [Nitriliruptorales bacterium]